jgi:hypothetical protein
MVTAGESISVVSESPYFGYLITRGGPCPNEFREGLRLAIGFEAVVLMREAVQVAEKYTP